METVKKISDYEKIKQMDRADLEEIVNHIATTGHCFDNLESHIPFSLMEWFRVYVMSDDFKKLDEKTQKEVFGHYDYARYTIRGITDYLYKHRMSEVWNN